MPAPVNAARTGSPSVSGAAVAPAFTLIELLIVMSILLVVAGFLAPSVSTILKGSNLTQGSQMISDQLGLARQTALAKNHVVEVRFYQYGDPEAAGESAATPNSGKFRALQNFEKLDTGTVVALGNVKKLPTSIIFDKGATLSSIIGSAAAAPGIPSLVTTQTNSIPRVGTQYNSVSFQFRPDGSTNLPTGNWFLTAHDTNSGDALATPPPNFFTLQIEAANGHIRQFRP